MSLIDVDQIFVDPAVSLGAGVIERLFVGSTANMAHRAYSPSFRVRSTLFKLFREPSLPKMGWFDDVIVDRDDLRDLCWLGFALHEVPFL